MYKRIIGNISSNFIIKAITYVFSFLTVMYVARVLRPEAFGRISFASSFAGFFVMIANAGIPIYAMRCCAENRDDRKELSKTVNELWSINLLLSLISAAVFIPAVLLIPRLRENGLLLLIYGSSIFFQLIGCEWLFKGLEKFRFLAVSAFICKSVSLLLIVLFVRSEEHTALYAVLSVLTGYGSNIVCFLMLRRHVDLSFRINVNRGHFKPLLLFFLMSCAVSIYSSLDLTMLGFMKGDFETGLYQLAAKGRAVLTVFGALVWTSALPLASELWKKGEKKRFESLADRSVLSVCGIQLLATVVCFTAAKEIMLIVGGEEYLESAVPFRILLLSLVPVGASNILGGQVLIPAGRESRLLRAELLGAAFNFLANLVLIPLLSITGAALTTTVSEIIVWFVCLYYVKTDLGIDLGLGPIAKAARLIRRELCVREARVLDRMMRDKLPYHCPCCDTYLKSFVSGEYDRRPETFDTERYRNTDQKAVCPICRSLPRHRILVSWMDRNIDGIKGRNILVFARSRALGSWMDRNGIVSVSADLYNPADLKLDIEDTGLGDDSFDLIICNHVLEHVSDYRKALRELHRIVRPGGRVIVSFPVDPRFDTVYEAAGTVSEQERIRLFGQADHLRVFGKDSPELLRSFGFEVSEIRGSDCDARIKPITGPADYDYNVLWIMEKPAVDG